MARRAQVDPWRPRHRLHHAGAEQLRTGRPEAHHGDAGAPGSHDELSRRRGWSRSRPRWNWPSGSSTSEGSGTNGVNTCASRRHPHAVAWVDRHVGVPLDGRDGGGSRALAGLLGRIRHELLGRGELRWGPGRHLDEDVTVRDRNGRGQAAHRQAPDPGARGELRRELEQVQAALLGLRLLGHLWERRPGLPPAPPPPWRRSPTRSWPRSRTPCRTRIGAARSRPMRSASLDPTPASSSSSATVVATKRTCSSTNAAGMVESTCLPVSGVALPQV